MIRRSISVFLLLCCSAIIASAAGNGQISGKVQDASGAALTGAVVTVTDLTSGASQHVVTGADGSFTVQGLSNDTQLVTIEKDGFQSFTQKISLATQPYAEVNPKLQLASLAATVVVRGTVTPGARPMPTRDEVQNSLQSIRVLDRKQLDAAGPVAGGAQMIALTPGANVFGYGVSGATKYTIQLNGLNQGWGGQPTGFISPGSLGITFDGIPIVDVATGLWQSATMPQNLLMQNVDVTYGPGAPLDRFYDSIGGSVEFTPIQPTVGSHLAVSGTYGTYGTKNLAFVGNTGNFHGWATVFGGGVGDANTYRYAQDGFNMAGQSGSAFGKTIREFSHGSFEFGAFYADAAGFRPPTIPLTAQGVTLTRPDGSTYDYSQATCGFYCGPSFAEYNKYDRNLMGLVYARENLLLNSTTSVTNTTWFMHISRAHHRFADTFSQGSQVDEWNNPHSNAFGNEIGLQKVLPFNTLNFGAYLIHEVYNTHNLFFDPAQGGDGSAQIVSAGAKFRSGYFQQDDLAFYAQDDVHPIPQIHIVPGVRVVAFSTSYSDQAARDFTLLPGVVPETHCSFYESKGTKTPDGLPFNDIFGTPTISGVDESVTQDQGSLCGAHESKNRVEPSIDSGVMPLSWLTFYGGYDVTYRSPSVGGGGGPFQAVNPAYYQLAEGAYAHGGVKIHFTNAPALGNFIVGVDYFHLDYTDQEIDYSLANGEEISNGGSSTYHGVNAFFDDDPMGNLHFFLNFSGEAANYTQYILGGVTEGQCAASPGSCTNYSGLPVSYVPGVTVNSGIYYGFVNHNDRTLIEPHFWVEYTGSQHIFNNNTGLPDTRTMPSYTTANASITVPFKHFNFQVDVLNLFDSKANTYEYVTSGGYFSDTPGSINVYPGAPLTAYGTITYQF